MSTEAIIPLKGAKGGVMGVRTGELGGSVFKFKMGLGSMKTEVMDQLVRALTVTRTIPRLTILTEEGAKITFTKPSIRTTNLSVDFNGTNFDLEMLVSEDNIKVEDLF